jgi:hypothetical protein
MADTGSQVPMRLSRTGHLVAIPRRHYVAVRESSPSKTMRAEIQNIVDEIKQSVGLLRRHL